jgi:hypothetical protein
MSIITLTDEQYADLMAIASRLSREVALDDMDAVSEQVDRLVEALGGVEVEADSDLAIGPTERELAQEAREARAGRNPFVAARDGLD